MTRCGLKYLDELITTKKGKKKNRKQKKRAKHDIQRVTNMGTKVRAFRAFSSPKKKSKIKVRLITSKV
jgi:hypothetical protein